MKVDGSYIEKWTISGTFSMLSSNKVFIGGSNQNYKLPGANTNTNFVGCMRKVNINFLSNYNFFFWTLNYYRILLRAYCKEDYDSQLIFLMFWTWCRKRAEFRFVAWLMLFFKEKGAGILNSCKRQAHTCCSNIFSLLKSIFSHQFYWC